MCHEFHFWKKNHRVCHEFRKESIYRYKIIHYQRVKRFHNFLLRLLPLKTTPSLLIHYWHSNKSILSWERLKKSKIVNNLPKQMSFIGCCRRSCIKLDLRLSSSNVAAFFLSIGRSFSYNWQRWRWFSVKITEES